MEHHHGGLCPPAFGVAFGLIYALGIFIVGLAAWLTGFGAEFVKLIASVYPGYAATLMGSIIGLVWAFVDAFIFAFLVAWVYNKFCNRCAKKSGETAGSAQL